MATSVRKAQVEPGDGFADDGGDALIEIPREAHTLNGFREWALSEGFPEKLPVTFLQGKVYLDMSKEDIEHHALVKTEVARVVANLNREVDLGHVFINGVLVTNKRAGVANNPDMVAVFWKTLESGRVQYVTRRRAATEILGTPDWILEIVSDSSVAKDTRKLRTAYHRAGIAEYWLIDARGAELDFQVLHWRKAGYVAAEASNGWLPSPAFERSFRLTRRRDRAGMWNYRLDIR